MKNSKKRHMLVCDTAYTFKFMTERGLTEFVTCKDVNGYFDKIWTVCTDNKFRGKGMSSKLINFMITKQLNEKNTNRNTMLLEVYNDHIISREENSNSYYAFLLTSSGLNFSPVITSIGPVYYNSGGYMKGSPNGNRLAVANHGFGLPPSPNNIEIYDFNNLNGTLSNLISLSNNGLDVYGIEFSPNSNVLYVSTTNYISQFDLSFTLQNDIQSSLFTVFVSSGINKIFPFFVRTR